VVSGVILANLPDVDVLLTPLFAGSSRHHNWHRTWSHSLPCNSIIVPLVSLAVSKVLGITLSSSALLASLCIASHLLTDWITHYGVRQ